MKAVVAEAVIVGRDASTGRAVRPGTGRRVLG